MRNKTWSSGCLAVIMLFTSVLSGCYGRGDEGKRVITDELNADSIHFLLQSVHRRGGKAFDTLKFDSITATTFQPPNCLVVMGTHRLGPVGKPETKTETGSYTLAVTAENHIVRVRMASTSIPGVTVNTDTIQDFDEALSRAFTTDAMQGIADGGITSVSVESRSMQIQVETPLR